jgi:hypothetical protein
MSKCAVSKQKAGAMLKRQEQQLAESAPKMRLGQNPMASQTGTNP